MPSTEVDERFEAYNRQPPRPQGLTYEQDSSFDLIVISELLQNGQEEWQIRFTVANGKSATLKHSGCEYEVIRDDILCMASRIASAGGVVEVIYELGMLHTWFVFYGFGVHDHECKKSVSNWARWINTHTKSS